MSSTHRGLGPSARKLSIEYHVLLMLVRSALQDPSESLLGIAGWMKGRRTRDRTWQGVAGLMSMDAPSWPLASLAYSAGRGPFRRHLRKAVWPVARKALDLIPGPGFVRDAAFMDGTMLFHDPVRHLRRAPRLVADALALAPAPVIAGAIVSGAFLRGMGIGRPRRSHTGESGENRASPAKR